MSPTPEEMAQSMIDNLPEKTGRTLDEWIAHLEQAGLAKHGEIVKHLKSKHGVTHGFANLISQKAREAASGGPKSEEDLVAAQYAKKQELLPIYERILSNVEAFGDDVEIAPKKTYVSLRRNKQFGILKPSTKTRMDVGIQLGEDDAGDRLQTGKRFGGMVSHQVEVTSADQVDEELIGWLRTAYERC